MIGKLGCSDVSAPNRGSDYFAEVLLLDQATTAVRARTELGWTPSRPTLVEEFRTGTYRT